MVGATPPAKTGTLRLPLSLRETSATPYGAGEKSRGKVVFASVRTPSFEATQR